MNEKAEIRARMKALRRAVPEVMRAAASRSVCEQLLARPLGDVVAVYLAGPDELDLSLFIDAALRRGMRLLAPQWTGETYELAELRGLSPSDLRVGPHGILEPSVLEEDADKVEAVSHRFTMELEPPHPVSWLVPGLAFTRDGRRLGYGGGWYDRLMADVDPSSVRLGVAYSFQVMDDLPSESHDVRLTEIVEALVPDRFML